jgi:hypothetical protein
MTPEKARAWLGVGEDAARPARVGFVRGASLRAVISRRGSVRQGTCLHDPIFMQKPQDHGFRAVIEVPSRSSSDGCGQRWIVLGKGPPSPALGSGLASMPVSVTVRWQHDRVLDEPAVKGVE